MNRLLSLLSVAVVILLFSFTGDASAQAQVHITPRAAEGADHIVNGRVISTIDVELNGEPHRVSEIEVTSTLKGSTAETILVEVSGGQLADGTSVIVSHTPSFSAGELVQVGLEQTAGALGANLSTAVKPGLVTYSVPDGIEGAYGLLPDGLGRGAAIGDYILHGLSWPDFTPPVVYKVNPSGSGLSSAATISAVQRGFQMWEDDPSSSIDFVYGGTTNKTGVTNDGETVVSFVTPSRSGSLAEASWFGAGGNITDFDVRVNPAFGWADGAVARRWDIGTTVGHEVGHGLGLTHDLTGPPASELMHFEILSGNIKGLGSGDRSGIQALYPIPYNGPVCNGVPVTVNLQTGLGSPTEGRDIILGTAGDDSIWGLGGDDLICGGLGVDRIYGGYGNDTIFGGGGSDRIYGQAGADEIYGGSGADKIYGGPAGDTIFGQGGQDSIWGEDGNDEIQGNWESDKIWGGAGNDVLRGAGGKDKLYGEQGNDALYGGLNTDYLNGGSGSDTGDGQRGRDKPLVPGVSGCEQLVVASSC